MFTLEQIRAAHAKVKSGADFPAYVKEIKLLGLASYAFYVSDGHTDYQGDDTYKVASPARYSALQVVGTAAADEFKKALKIHQQGGTDFLTFCRQAADCGVEKWVVDAEKMRCTYFDRSGTIMVEEVIPG